MVGGAGSVRRERVGAGGKMGAVAGVGVRVVVVVACVGVGGNGKHSWDKHHNPCG